MQIANANVIQFNPPSKTMTPHSISHPIVHHWSPSPQRPSRPYRRPGSPPILLAIFTCALFLIVNLLPVHASIELLRKFQRRCFEVDPCIFFSDDQRSYGCAQCKDISEATMVEYVTQEELFLFTSFKRDHRVVMLPEFLFFEEAVMSALLDATNIEALIVYEGDSPNNNPQFAPNDTLPFPPVNDLSVDVTEPNLRNNYYTGMKISNVEEAITLTEVTTALTNLTKRNPKGTGLKFRVFPYNIFRITAATANIIRNSSLRFSDVEDIGAQPGSSGNRTSTSPRYKLQSLGQMFACPPETQTSPEADGREEPDVDSLASRLKDVKSKECLNDNTCLPIGGQSLWSALGNLRPQNHSHPGSPRILAITAPMDSMAFFPNLALGASAEISSLAVLMAVAKAVDEYRREKGFKEVVNWQPVYFAWNAQSWGYAGSSRFLKDVRDFKCKEKDKGKAGCAKPFMASLKFQDFKNASYAVLNLGQLISPISNSGEKHTVREVEHPFYYHRFPGLSDRNESVVLTALKHAFDTHDYTDSLGKIGKLSLSRANVPILPTDASQSFYRYERDADVISLTNYNQSFTNVFYHSMFDNGSLTVVDENRWRVPLYEVAGVISEAVIDLAFDDSDATIDADRSLIDGVIACMTNWTECGLAKEYIMSEVTGSDAEHVMDGNYAGSFYPSTRLRDTKRSWATKLDLIHAILSFHNQYNVSAEGVVERQDGDGEVSTPLQNCTHVNECDLFNDLNNNAENQSDLHTVVCAKGKCVVSDTYLHDAFGTGISGIDDSRTQFSTNVEDDGMFKPMNPPEGAWTESYWDTNLGLCGYVEDTTAYGIGILGAGLAVLVVCFGLALGFDYFMFKNGRVVATPNEDNELTRDMPLLPQSP